MKKYLVVDEHEKQKAKQSMIKLENFEKYIKNVFNFSCPIVARFLKIALIFMI